MQDRDTRNFLSKLTLRHQWNVNRSCYLTRHVGRPFQKGLTVSIDPTRAGNANVYSFTDLWMGDAVQEFPPQILNGKDRIDICTYFTNCCYIGGMGLFQKHAHRKIIPLVREMMGFPKPAFSRHRIDLGQAVLLRHLGVDQFIGPE